MDEHLKEFSDEHRYHDQAAAIAHRLDGIFHQQVEILDRLEHVEVCNERQAHQIALIYKETRNAGGIGQKALNQANANGLKHIEMKELVNNHMKRTEDFFASLDALGFVGRWMKWLVAVGASIGGLMLIVHQLGQHFKWWKP